jgi:hypothetical protein
MAIRRAAGRVKSSASSGVKIFLLWSVLALVVSAPAVLAIPKAVIWRLTAKAKMSGPDFAAQFEVPVFQVAGVAAAAAMDAPDPTAPLQMPVEELRRDEHSKIQVTDGPDGREFYFPAARNPGAAIFTTIFFGFFRRNGGHDCPSFPDYF